MRILTALLALSLLTACANTREGISKDSQRWGQKSQQIGQILTTP